jgi:site-specific DNA-methyltransferase (adenine-specific)
MSKWFFVEGLVKMSSAYYCKRCGEIEYEYNGNEEYNQYGCKYCWFIYKGGSIMTTGYYGSSINSHDNGGTPGFLKQQIREEFGDFFDPCPNNPNFDGLSLEWHKISKIVYVNPPYSRGNISNWVKKCHKEYENGCTVILLIPSYTDTLYFHKYIYGIAELRFIKGRLKFEGYNKKASFPSMLCIFRGGE